MSLNRIYKVAFCLLGLTLFHTSCQKDFLDKNPLASYSTETFWVNEANVKLNLIAVYSTLNRGTEGISSAANSWDAVSDDAFWNPINGLTTYWTSMELGQHNPSIGGIVSDGYSVYYSSIAQCNYFLDNVTRVPMAPALLAGYQAEVRALRAYYYFQLTQLYGGVIVTLKTETAVETYPKKSTKEEVVKVILDDLDFAIANLSNNTLGTTTAGYQGRIIKGTAQGLKAKVLLFNNRFAEAATAAAALINDPTNPFNLYTDYRGLFFKPGQRNAANKEIMLAARYQAGSLTHNFDLRNGYIVAYSALQPIKNLIDSYECTDGKPISTSPLYNPAKPYDNRDPRLKYTAYVPGEIWPAKGPTAIFQGNESLTATGFLLRKGLDEAKNVPTPINNATQSDQDFVLLRYADVLLIYAEAQNEAVGPDATVYNSINKVRNRVSVNMPSLPAGLTQAEMRDRIRSERRYEFAFEGMRYFDLLRWKTAGVVLNAITNPNGNRRVFDESKNYVLPFPQSQIDIMAGSLVQNPGYR